MADIHVDDFCRDAALALLHLYNRFPRKQALYVEDISGPDEPDEVGLHSKRYMSCLGTLLWLEEEGYIRYESLIYQDGIDQVVLTNKTFVILSAASDIRYDEPDEDLPPSVFGEKLTIVEQIRTALRSNHSGRITAIMRYFLSQEPSTLIGPAPE